MKKCLLMFGLLILTLVIAMIAGLSESKAKDNNTVVGAKTNVHDLLTDLDNH
ncbi:MAG: hypothetical protein WBB27_06375 [Maribacter sp.]